MTPLILLIVVLASIAGSSTAIILGGSLEDQQGF